MAAFTGTVNIYEADTGASIVANAPSGYKEILVCLDGTADDGDTQTVTLADYGITTLWMVKGYTHATGAEGVGAIIEEAPTTAVATGVLTITIGGGTDNCFRVFIVGGV
jgi:hypothetical protein